MFFLTLFFFFFFFGLYVFFFFFFFFSSRRRHTRYIGDWSSDVCSSDLVRGRVVGAVHLHGRTSAERHLQHVRDQMRLGIVVLAVPRRRPRRVEVAETDRAHSVPRRVVQIGRASCRERVWIAVGG